MSRLGRYINRYRVFWLAMLAAFALFVYWMLFVTPASPLYTEVDPQEVRTTALGESSEREPTIGERASPLNLNAEGAEFSVSSRDGQLIMRLWADTAVKEGPVINVDGGVLQFEMAGGNSLLVRVSQCVIQMEAEDLVTVSGDITGNIRGTGQYFSGRELSWDRQQHVVSAGEVFYVGPNIEVRGEEMAVDLRTGKVEFKGPVEAGV